MFNDRSQTNITLEEKSTKTNSLHSVLYGHVEKDLERYLKQDFHQLFQRRWLLQGSAVND